MEVSCNLALLNIQKTSRKDSDLACSITQGDQQIIWREDLSKQLFGVELVPGFLFHAKVNIDTRNKAALINHCKEKLKNIRLKPIIKI